MPLSRKPTGATIVWGPESAYQIAQLLYGKTPGKKVLMDLGIMDIGLESKKE